MCLGTVAQVTGLAGSRGVEVRAGERALTASLLAVTDPVQPGDWVLVHSGLVLARLTDQEAREALELRTSPTEGAS
jgi:hydrogenase maturation factor